MQNGSVIRAERRRGPDVWEFRWREPGADGKRRHRRIVLGSVEQVEDEVAARQAISALKLEFNRGSAWLKTRSASVYDLVSHYRERELDPDTVWKTHSTKVTYEGYLNKWILPRWENYPLVRVNAGEVELWLRSLPLARSSCAKIRNLMSVVFNHGIRHEICDRNPIQLVRQSAKRKAVPVILSASEVQKLLGVLGIRERTLVLLAFGTGLRMSELFGLKWNDIDFRRNEISVTRSIVFQVVGPCKTEASQKPVPLDSRLAEALKVWRDYTKYSKADDWVFASPAARGKRPYWGQCLMRTIIRPAAAKIGITQRIGLHTSRHTYSSLLKANKTDIKVTQELLRHASSRVTLDTYTQAVTVQKRRAQSSVIRLLQACTTGAG
ncbi:MAG: site-specific integrase [Acidobacteria bacterium]|nr:MAG: site-specific integrase [Acidobacteriota bacterium]PYX41933.1 MAG: site-specific integrase [Acidobacteriota bacterium]